MKSRRACFVCTHSLTLATLYKGLFPYLRSQGWEIDVIVGDHEYSDFPEEHFGVLKPYVIPMRRLPSPAADAMGLIRFISFFTRNRYDVIHISTPKASLLASIAAAATFNGRVMFVYRRCVYELMSGLKRTIYVNVDRLISRFSIAVVPISRQLDVFLREAKVCAPEKLVLLGSGSSNGLDTQRFKITPGALAAGDALRQNLGIPDGAPVVLFIGRVCGEKGVDLLPPIFERVRSAQPNAHLVVVGPDDERDPASAHTVRYFAESPFVHRVGYVEKTEDFYSLCTVFLFPSFFEGFGNVLLEAAGMERASVGFRVPGVEEAVADGVSGLLVEKGDVVGASEAVLRLLTNPAERRDFELRARKRVVEQFDRIRVWNEIETLMQRLASS
ncbi:glycosyltransferase [Bradyrhizobium sp. 4]|uniref:glycosyltransferase n=1 Tax=unclassified Bradyrhizobium TaxID=2631580 RepID=UPI001FF86246|nr:MULTISPECIES: glycosyltransferase [unclassified Bradyrhizobium]MCK1397431.1 glycosyltransferase [Bradyrhizobium sp. 39]MCK1752530.1 glycosyltransferase [Bradyrhizobium sp. 135]UPJ36749.1 glycosyltransferase [Bradyrhizobium sp. 4]